MYFALLFLPLIIAFIGAYFVSFAIRDYFSKKGNKRARLISIGAFILSLLLITFIGYVIFFYIMPFER
nr:putative PurR-regulated permease PerM [Mucilaginibacter sp. E4BP6]